jgi:hypothetical protein
MLGLLYELQLSILNAIGSIKNKDGNTPIFIYKWLLNLLERNDNGQNLVMGIRKQNDTATATTTSTAPTTLNTKRQRKMKFVHSKLIKIHNLLYSDVEYIGTLLKCLVHSIPHYKFIIVMHDHIQYYINYDRAYPSPNYRLTELCKCLLRILNNCSRINCYFVFISSSKGIECLSELECIILLYQQKSMNANNELKSILNSFNYELLWETHKSPRVRLSCLKSIIQIYGQNGCGKLVVSFICTICCSFHGANLSLKNIVQSFSSFFRRAFLSYTAKNITEFFARI